MKFRYSSILILGLLGIITCGKNGAGPEPKPQPHIIKQPEVVNIQTEGALITWETDVETNSTIKYGTASGSYSLTETKSLEEKKHSITLKQLQPNTTYSFIAESKNSGGSVSSSEQQFTTLKTLSQLSQFAWENYQNGSFNEAISAFKELLVRQPNSADAYNGLGWCYTANQVDSLDRAVKNFELAVQNQANFIEAIVGRGFVLLAQKQYSKAILDFDAAIRMNPNFVFSHNQAIDYKDIHLGLAEANFFKQNYNLAQTELNILEPNNGLDANRQETWVVDGISYNSYSEALLSWIEKLKAIV